MISQTEKKFFGVTIRVVTLALSLVTLGASAALAQSNDDIPHGRHYRYCPHQLYLSCSELWIALLPLTL